MTKMHVYLIVSLIFALLIAIFAIQNVAVVPIRILFWSYEASLVLVILGSVLIGVIITMLFELFQRLRRGAEHRELEKQVHHLTKENEDLQKALAEKGTGQQEAKAVAKAVVNPAGADKEQGRQDGAGQAVN